MFETDMNRNLIYIHGYNNCVAHNDQITWVSKNSWEMLPSEFSHAERIIACRRKIICNKCEKNNTRGEIWNAGDNVDQFFLGLQSHISKLHLQIYMTIQKIND